MRRSRMCCLLDIVRRLVVRMLRDLTSHVELEDCFPLSNVSALSGAFNGASMHERRRHEFLMM
jgi:hypothetical protein